MRGYGLSIFQRAASFQIGGDAGGAKRMTTDPNLHAKSRRPALNHPPDANEFHLSATTCA